MTGILPAGGAAPLQGPAPLAAAPAATPALSSPTLTASPASADQLASGATPSYVQSDFSPQGVQLPDQPTLTPAQQQQLNAFSGLLRGDVLSAAQRQELMPVARSLGFPDVEALAHALRSLDQPLPVQPGRADKLPARQVLLDRLRAQGLAPEPRPPLTDVVGGVLHEALGESLAAVGQPPPQLISEPEIPSLWDVPALAAVYNGVETLRRGDPERLRSVARLPGPGQPLVFVMGPAPQMANPDQFLAGMEAATRIAHADDELGRVHLYQTAVTGDHRSVTGQIVDKLELVSRVHDGQMQPIYHGEEFAHRDLLRHPDESQRAHAERLYQTLLSDYLPRFGQDDWQKLQTAVNFVLRYEGLNKPEHTQGRPYALVPENGQAQDPRTLAALQRMHPSYLMQVMARLEQVDALGQIQDYLRVNLPGSENIHVDGLMGRETQHSVTAFQTSLALNNAKERIEDDPLLPETEKRSRIESLNTLFQRLSADPEQAPAILGALQTDLTAWVQETPSPLAPATQSALQSDLSGLERLVTGVFDRGTAESLVGNWFNVLDSGQGHDLAEQLVIHELGHLWEAQFNRENPHLRLTDNWELLCAHPAAQTEFAMTATNRNDATEVLGSDQTAASDYGASNAGEDFAEASRLFVTDPERLLRRSLMKFLVQNSLSNTPYSQADVLKLATDCGYSRADLLARLDSLMGFGPEGLTFKGFLGGELRADYGELHATLKAEAAAAEEVSHAATDSPASTEEATEPERGTEVEATLLGLGADDIQALGLTSAAAALLERQLVEMGYGDPVTGKASPQGLALVGALAIYHATGSCDLAAHPALREALGDLAPDFAQLIAHPRFAELMAPAAQGGEVSSTRLLAEALEQLRWLRDANRASYATLGRIPVRLEEKFWEPLRSLIGPEPGLREPALTRRAQELLKQEAIRELLPDRLVSSVLLTFNRVLREQAALLGVPAVSVSPAFMRELIIKAVLQDARGTSAFQELLATEIRGNLS